MPPKRKSVPERDRSPAGRVVAPAEAPRSVWLVVRGEDYEGYSNLGVFASREQAVACAKGSLSVGQWEKEEADVRWKDGCFYIEIHEETLWPSYADMRQHIEREMEEFQKRQEADRLARREAGD